MGREDPINRFSHKKKEEIAQGKKEGRERVIRNFHLLSAHFSNFPREKMGARMKSLRVKLLESSRI